MIYAALAKRFGKVAAVLIVAGLAVALAVAVYAGIKRYFTAGLETQVKVSKGQTGAAIESGAAAVNRVGNRQEAEAAGAANVQEAQNAIHNATDPAGATGAGLDGLHHVRGRKAPGGSR